MKVVLVYPRRLDTPNHPLGILYIAAAMEQRGFEVNVIDADFDETTQSVVNKVKKCNGDIVGIGANTSEINFALDIAKTLKLESSIPIVLGGIHPTILPEEVIRNEFVDYVVIGEGEVTFTELCEAIKKGKDVKNIKGIGYKYNGSICFTKPREPIENLDELPFPARHLLPYRWYFAPPRIRGVWTNTTATVMTSRGCPYRCIFCSSHLMFGRKVRFRSPGNVMEEIKHLREKFRIDAIWFADDTFTVNPKHVKKLCELIRAEKWKDFKWACQARVNTINLELLKEMRRAGCAQVDFGVESGSPSVLKILKKDITPEQVIEAFRITKEAGLLRFASFIIGTPGETEEDIKLTEKLVLKIKPDYADFLFAVPFPGTELYQLAESYGVFDKNTPYNEWILGKQTDKPVMCTDLTEEQLIKWRSRLHNHFFLSNYKNFVKDPRFIFGGMGIFFKGLRGLLPGINRFCKTRKFDSILMEVLRAYRSKTKRQIQQPFQYKTK